MKKLLAGLLGMVLLAACGGGPAQTNQDKDAAMLADALRAADMDGSGFKLDNQLTLTGGDIPPGQEFMLHATVSGGVLKDGTAQFPYHLQQNNNSASDYNVLFAEGRLYMRKRGASGWKATLLGDATTLYAALRLDVIRETVLLATSVAQGGLGHVDAGFARKYVVKPALDQLEQLLAVSVEGAAAQQWMRSTSAEVDVFLTVPDNKLGRVEVHAQGADPSNGEMQQIQSVLDLRSAKASVAREPADAQLVAPADLLT